MLTVLHDMGHALRVPVTFVVVEFVGTMAFAISGARLASAKRFDLFGAYIVGMATAIGGGTLRDLMLGLSPFWLTNSIYLWCCALALLVVHLFGRYLITQKNTLFIFDTIGLALFNMIGIEKTLGMGFPWWTAVIMGSITGAAGGVIRDIFIGEVPLIFRKEIYALACVAGGIIYILCSNMQWGPEIAGMTSSLVVITTRVLAVKYHWHLPILKGEE